MGRPQSVVYKNLPLYDKLHTVKQRMYSKVELTALHHIKETKEWYLGLESWCYCVDKFKLKKKNLPELSLNLPIINDEKVIEFLKENCWADWVTKQKEDTDIIETIALLDKIFPDKKKVFFYELESIIGRSEEHTSELQSQLRC